MFNETKTSESLLQQVVITLRSLPTRKRRFRVSMCVCVCVLLGAVRIFAHVPCLNDVYMCTKHEE